VSKIALSITGVLLLTLTGCGGRIRFDIENRGSFYDTPEGRAAVLRVTADRSSVARTGHVTWGAINTTDITRRFAACVAHAAAQEGAMEVMPALKVEQALYGLAPEPTLQPTDEQLRRYAAELDLSSYLVADVRCSRLRYVLFWSWASVEYALSCHDARDGSLLWWADVEFRDRLVSDQEAIHEALRRTFRWLRHNSEGKESPSRCG
jgi:hypothetical protein